MVLTLVFKYEAKTMIWKAQNKSEFSVLVAGEYLKKEVQNEDNIPKQKFQIAFFY